MIILSPAGLGGACCTRAAVSCQTFQLPGFELWGRITCKLCFFLFPQYSTRQPLWAVGFAFPGYCCYCSCALQMIFFLVFFPPGLFSSMLDVSSTALAALVSPAHLLSPMPVSSPVASNQLLLCKPFSLQCQHTGSTLGTEQPLLSAQLAFIPKDPSFSYILGLSSLQSHP